MRQSGSRTTGSGGPDANAQLPNLTGAITGKASFQVTSADDGTVYKCSQVVLKLRLLFGRNGVFGLLEQRGNTILDCVRWTECDYMLGVVPAAIKSIISSYDFVAFMLFDSFSIAPNSAAVPVDEKCRVARCN